MEPAEELEALARLNVAPGPQAFTLARDPKFGRLAVAARDLAVGDTVIEERPLCWAPMLDSAPVCLTCCRPVTREGFRCPGCGWPMCGTQCAKAVVHRDQECRVYRQAGKKLDCQSWDFTQQQPLYTLVTVLRALGLAPGPARVAASLESHLAAWRARPEFARYSDIAAHLRTELGLAVEEAAVLGVIASSFTNDFSHGEPGAGEVHLLLPLTAMLNHSCFPNISRAVRKTADGRFLMRVVAARPIKAGHQIFNCYTDILDPVQVRRAGLQEAKNMLCQCERCVDPRDLGSLGNAVLCPACRGALQPPGPEGGPWTCDSCAETRPGAQVEAVVLAIDQEQKAALGDPGRKTVRGLEKLLSKWGRRLHPSNLLLTRVKYNLVGLYGRQPGFTQGDMTEQLWKRKRELCEEVLETLKVLEPGLTVRKARLLQELHLPLLMLGQLHLAQEEERTDGRKELQRGIVTLGLATRVFEGEPEGSWERDTARRNQQTIAQVKQLLASL